MDAEEYNRKLDFELTRDGIVDEALFLKFCEAYRYDAATSVNWVSAKLRVLKARLDVGKALSIYEIELKLQVEVSSGAEYIDWVKRNFPGIDL